MRRLYAFWVSVAKEKYRFDVYQGLKPAGGFGGARISWRRTTTALPRVNAVAARGTAPFEQWNASMFPCRKIADSTKTDRYI